MAWNTDLEKARAHPFPGRPLRIFNTELKTLNCINFPEPQARKQEGWGGVGWRLAGGGRGAGGGRVWLEGGWRLLAGGVLEGGWLGRGRVRKVGRGLAGGWKKVGGGGVGWRGGLAGGGGGAGGVGWGEEG